MLQRWEQTKKFNKLNDIRNKKLISILKDNDAEGIRILIAGRNHLLGKTTKDDKSTSLAMPKEIENLGVPYAILKYK